MPSETSSSIPSQSPIRLRKVEPGRRLVEEEHRRPRHERRGQVEAPAHAARVGADEPSAGLDEVEGGQQLVGAGARWAAAHVVEQADHLEVLEAGQVLVDRCVLPGQADVLTNALRLALDVDPGDPRLARVGAEERRQDADGRCLACAVGA